MLVMSCTTSFSQGDTSTFKAQFALGANHPSKNGFVSGFEAKPLNFPTVNLGLQYLFRPALGAKLDFGFNRIASKSSSQDFKVNYLRINLQAVYNANRIFDLPQNKSVFFHAGPGISMIQPLNDFSQNKMSFPNAMAGVELHFGLFDNLSIYVDASYIYGFSEDFSPMSEGFGSFNGNLLTLTVGASISLSGCYFCERYE